MANSVSIELESLKNSILKLLKQHGGDLNIKQIGWGIDLRGSKYVKKITRVLKVLEKENLIIKTNNYKFRYRHPKNTISGVISINKRGQGYVSTKLYREDIFINRNNTLNSLHKDTVSIKLISSRKNKLEAIVTKVLIRANTKFIGHLKTEKESTFFIADDHKISDFFIPKGKLKSAKNNDRVIIELTDWPLSTGCPFGRVIKIFDYNVDLKTQINASIELFSIRNSFSQLIHKELEKLPNKIYKKDLTNRRDFRDATTFTIDPIDAKDFDDAISINRLKQQIIEIGIHIADVSHYVKPTSEIDKEALLRAFSVYFPGKVIPMLPEKLSNELCSLRQGEDKLSFSVVASFNNKYKLESVWMGKGIINSNKRFTYEEAEDLINKKRGGFSKEIIVLNTIANELKLQRLKNGSINFERSDIKFELNEQKEPSKVIKQKSLSSQKLVEEFMLLANKLVAAKLTKLKSSIYRVHDLPEASRIKELALYLNQSNSKKTSINISAKNLSFFINKLLQTKYKYLNRSVVENLVLRAMAKAKYSTKNIGHYGLGFDKYTHFTSPIRRYSDLIIHRLLYQHLNNKNINLLDLDKKCAHFSNVEKIYLDIERKINKFIQLKLLEESIGCAFRGFISGITKWGIYVEIEAGQGEGLISINNLSDDKYYYNDSLHTLIGRRTGKKYILGQELNVEIQSINLFKQEMDLVFAL